MHLGLEILVAVQAHAVGSELSVTSQVLYLSFAMTLKLHGSLINSFSVQFFKYHSYRSDCT